MTGDTTWSSDSLDPSTRSRTGPDRTKGPRTVYRAPDLESVLEVSSTTVLLTYLLTPRPSPRNLGGSKGPFHSETGRNPVSLGCPSPGTPVSRSVHPRRLGHTCLPRNPRCPPSTRGAGPGLLLRQEPRRLPDHGVRSLTWGPERVDPGQDPGRGRSTGRTRRPPGRWSPLFLPPLLLGDPSPTITRGPPPTRPHPTPPLHLSFEVPCGVLDFRGRRKSPGTGWSGRPGSLLVSWECETLSRFASGAPGMFGRQ